MENRGVRSPSKLSSALASRLDTFRFRSFASGRLTTKKKIAIVFGNCQARPLGRMMERSDAFDAEYQVVPVPPVHEITAPQRRILGRLLPKVDLIIGQPIGDDYRNMGVGLSQIEAACHRGTRTVRWPPLYWNAPFPHMVYVHPKPRESIDTPLVRYHDLRFLACADSGLDVKGAHGYLDSYVPAADGLALVTSEAVENLRNRERSCDAEALSLLESREPGPRTFWTVNHPTRVLFQHIASQVHDVLGLPFTPSPVPDLLKEVVAPIEYQRAGADPHSVDADWVVNGRAISRRQLMSTHISWYRENPDVIKAGLSEHEVQISMLGINPSDWPH